MDTPSSHGRRFWRSLEERLDSEEFRRMLRRDHPDQAESWLDPVSRRRFLALLGASLGLAGLAGCGSSHPPREKIVPYVMPPEQLVPGIPQYYATCMNLAGAAVGLLVESHEGRPTKIEGNPSHPVSLGATDIFSQASVLGLYDPDRSQTPLRNGRITSWEEAQAELRRRFRERMKQGGKGVRFLTEAVASPTLAARLDQLLETLPQARWIEYEPARLDPDVEGARIVFGKPLHVRYDFAKADVIVSLDADFLSCGGGQLKYVRDFTSRRRLGDGAEPMNRLYAVECSPSNTGMIADHRLTLLASQIETFARLLARELKVGEVPATGALTGTGGPVGEGDRRRPDQETAGRQADALRRRGRGRPAARRPRPGLRHQRQTGKHRRNRPFRPGADYQGARGAWPRCKNWPKSWSAAKWKCCSSWAATRFTRPRPTCVSASGSARRRRASTSASITTKRPRSASGTFPRRIIWKPGATAAPTTARRRSRSR